MDSPKYNTGMALGSLCGLLAAYLLNHYWNQLYIELSTIIIGPFFMWVGMWLGRILQKRYLLNDNH